ncbi:MAG: TolC family protein [Helicobacter sp.]|uniref:TolC family protein n=1 Tax=Helicobacter sp. 10-6591 TaxID=2004998 RepID=UPI000DCE8CE5|nr:TolC family protein [Helicobacter sp. 10-6591]MDD7567897.1 TolC family protein [Helicobacter sp.]MDY5740006.1 TolC family protein [Helicobacter sp.]RAX55992.1 ABC transporter permease [Helicobacter sp. 10-6591]
MKLITFALPLFFAFSILLGESKLLQPETKKNYNDFNNLSFNEILNFLSTTDKGFTLNELLEGTKNNYNLEAKELAILQAQANKIAATREFLPTLDGNYSFQDTNNTYRKIQNQSASLKANWEIFSGFKTYNKMREKDSLYRSSIADRASMQEQLFLNVIEQYYSYFSNQARFVSLEQKHRQLEVNIKRLERLYRSGLTTIDDIESLRAEILTTEHDIANIVLEIEKNKLVLSLLTNLDVKNLTRTSIKAPNFTLQKRQDIIALEEQANSLRYQVKQVTYLPSITISDTFSWNSLGSVSSKPALDELFGTSGAGSGLGGSNFMKMSYPPSQNVIGISVNMRIFDWLNLAKQKEALRYGSMKLQKELAYKKHEQEKDELLYRKSLEIAQAKIKSAQAALKSASVGFENVAKKYDSQILNFTDYLQSLSRKFDAEATYNKALNDYEIEKARYLYYSGQEIEGNIEK